MMIKKALSIFLAMILVMGTLVFEGCSKSTSIHSQDKGITLYVGNVAASLPSTYMPWLSNQGIATTVSSSVYSTLFNYDEDKNVYTPNLAESWEYVVSPDKIPANQDYLEVKVTLCKDVKWSDGTPVTAKDIYFTYDLAADFGRTNHAGALAWVGDLMHTYKKNKDGKYELERQGIFYKDNPGSYKFGTGEDRVFYFHVRKVLGAITPLFTTVLVLPEHLWNVISPKNQLNNTDPIPSIKKLYDNPIGSGPYTLDTEKSNSSIIVLNKRKDYHQKDDSGNDLYKPDVIKIINYMDLNVAINALKKGDIDVINATIDAAYMENLSSTKDLKLDFSPGRFIDTLVLNVNVPTNYSAPQRETLKIPAVREAIALAIDQQELINQMLKGKGSPVSPGLVRESSSFYNPDVGIVKPDIQKANKLLEEAGFIIPQGEKYRQKNGVKLSYKISGSQATKNLINYIQVQLNKIGIEITFEEGGSNAVRERYYTGDFDMTIQSVIFDMTNVDMMMTAHFVTVGSSSNYGRLVDQELSEKINSMRTTLDMAQKVQKLKEIQLAIANLHYKIPLYCKEVVSVYRTDTFDGWTTDAGTIIFNTETLTHLKKK